MSRFQGILSTLLTLAVLAGVTLAAVGGSPELYPASALSDIEVFPLGEWVEVNGTGRIYQFDLEAGQAVEIKFGRHIMPLTLNVYGPDYLDYANKPLADQPLSGEIFTMRRFHTEAPVELFTIVAKETGRFLIQMSPSAPGPYAVFCGRPRPATERDRKIMEAARLMFEITAAYRGKVPYDTVLPQAQKRVALFREVGDPASLATALNVQSGIHHAVNDLTGALKALLDARSVYFNAGRVADGIDLSPCFLYEALGEIQKWIHCGQENITLSRNAGLSKKEAIFFREQGQLYHRLADEVKAADQYSEALTLWRRMSTAAQPFTSEQVQLLLDLGNLKRGVIAMGRPLEFFPARSAADIEASIGYYKQALELMGADRSGYRPSVLHQLGAAHHEIGRLDEALQYLEQAERAFQGSPGSQALVWSDMAKLHIDRGNKQLGLEYLERALPLLERFRIPSERMASLFIKAGQLERGRAVHNTALESARKQKDLARTASALAGLADVERRAGNFNNARTYIVEAIEIVESLRKRIMDDEVRSTYFAAVKKYYDLYIALLMQAHRAQPERGFERIALEMSERARSRNLVDLLRLSAIDIKQGVNADLLDSEKAVRQRLAEKAAKQLRVTAGAEAEALKKEVAELSARHEALEARIRSSSPGYAALTQPAAITFEQVQSLLDTETVLLEYTLGEEKSYLWVVSRDVVTSFEFPSRSLIEGQVRAFYGHLTERNLDIKGETPAIRQSRIARADTEYQKAADQLAKVLISPAYGLLRNKRILVVPDGALNYVPYTALPSPDGQAARMIGQMHEVVILPSAAALAVMREEAGRRKTAPNFLAVFADPVFSAGDKRISGSSGASTQPLASNRTRDMEVALESTGLGGDPPRLPFSRREADSIYGNAPGGSNLKKVDFEASKGAVLRAGLDRFRIVHFATHGLMDSRHPALSGIVLSLVDERAKEIDGFLRLQDIYNLKLNADLVVLSACSTALGKEVRGEGIIGLTRGFMYAGSPRVVASLWKVDDVATAHLMSVFYRKMLTENMRPAAALRAAQLDTMRQSRWRSPYYWAPFILQGEWK